jgi:hypothetical protein
MRLHRIEGGASDACRSGAYANLDQASYATAWTSGWAITLEQAIAQGLGIGAARPSSRLILIVQQLGSGENTDLARRARLGSLARAVPFLALQPK